LKAIATEIDEGEDGLLRLAGARKPARRLPTRLLGSFDPVLHGWASRDWVIPSEDARKVVTTNGIFRPTMMVDGRIRGVWTAPGGEVELVPFEDLDPKVMKRLERDGENLAEYLDRG